MTFASGSLRAALAASKNSNETITSNNDDANRLMKRNDNNSNNKTRHASFPFKSASNKQQRNQTAKKSTSPPSNTTNTTTPPNPASKELASKNDLSWTCVIAPSAEKSRADVALFLQGLIKALMLIHPPSWIKPHRSASNTDKKITKESDVQEMTMEDINNFAEDWRYVKGNKLIMRVRLVTDMPMDEILQIEMFSTWMRKNKVQLNISELTTPRPIYAGFFKETLAETKRLRYFKALLDQVYHPTDLFSYQIVVRTLYLENTTLKTQFFLILADPLDASAIRQTFSDSIDTIGIEYQPWTEYANLDPLQKGYILTKQKEVQDNYRCAIVPGITDTNPTMLLQPARTDRRSPDPNGNNIRHTIQPTQQHTSNITKQPIRFAWRYR
jgi:hypothetical protein